MCIRDSFNPLFTEDGQRSFLMLLKQLLKTKPYVELSHMAGILSIAKHSTGSELNMFVEYGAVEDLRYDRFFGLSLIHISGAQSRAP